MSGCFDRREFLWCAGFGFLAGLPVVLAAGVQTSTGRRYPIPAADSVTIDRQAQLILVRYQNQVYAFNLSCPHQNAAVKWLAKDQRFQCTKHDSKYTPVGVYTSGRATRNMDRLPVQRDGDSVVIDTSRMIQSDKEPSAWANAKISL
jgi:Rieske Fe-S protein